MKISQTYNGKTHSAFVRHTIDASANDDDPAVALARVFDKVEADIAEIRAARRKMLPELAGAPASPNAERVAEIVRTMYALTVELAEHGVETEVVLDGQTALTTLVDLGVETETRNDDSYDLVSANATFVVAGRESSRSHVRARHFVWLDWRDAQARRTAKKIAAERAAAAEVDIPAEATDGETIPADDKAELPL